VTPLPNRLPPGKRDEFKQLAEQLHQLGPVVFAYFIIEITEGGDVSETLAHYLRTLTPELLQVVGADRWDAEATAQAAALGYVDCRGRA
jgi:hypothetical protein